MISIMISGIGTIKQTDCQIFVPPLTAFADFAVNIFRNMKGIISIMNAIRIDDRIHHNKVKQEHFDLPRIV